MTIIQQHLKTNFMAAYAQFRGNISRTCQAIKINRSTFYDWCRDDENFKNEVANFAEEIVDDYEDLLAMHAKTEVSAVIFGLKCLGRRRGWSERITIETPPVDRLIDQSVVTSAIQTALHLEKERLKKSDAALLSENTEMTSEEKKLKNGKNFFPVKNPHKVKRLD